MLSIKLMSRVWDSSPYTHTMLLLHIAMADAANDEGEFHYKQETLAKKARVSVRYLRDVTQRMVEDGYLEVQKMRWGRLTYRLLTPQEGNSVPVGGELSSGNRGTQFRSQGNSVPVTTEPSTEPSEEPSEEPKITGPSGPGGDPEVEMGIVGAWDEDAEMPEGGAPPPRKKKPFEEAKKRGTHGWVLERFEAERAKAKVGTTRYNRGHLNRLLKSLRDDDGMTNEEIVVLIEVFFIRHGRHIQTKAKEIDLVRIFQQMVPQLRAQSEGLLRNTSEGTSSTEHWKKQGEDLKARLMGLT